MVSAESLRRRKGVLDWIVQDLDRLRIAIIVQETAVVPGWRSLTSDGSSTRKRSSAGFPEEEVVVLPDLVPVRIAWTADRLSRCFC